MSSEVILAYLPEDSALFSVGMPGDPITAVITVVIARLKRAYTNIIGNDDVAEACTIHLIECGAPVFTDVGRHTAYRAALESALGDGLTPAAARDRALAFVGEKRPRRDIHDNLDDR